MIDMCDRNVCHKSWPAVSIRKLCIRTSAQVNLNKLIIDWRLIFLIKILKSSFPPKSKCAVSNRVPLNKLPTLELLIWKSGAMCKNVKWKGCSTLPSRAVLIKQKSALQTLNCRPNDFGRNLVICVFQVLNRASVQTPGCIQSLMLKIFKTLKRFLVVAITRIIRRLINY